MHLRYATRAKLSRITPGVSMRDRPWLMRRSLGSAAGGVRRPAFLAHSMAMLHALKHALLGAAAQAPAAIFPAETLSSKLTAACCASCGRSRQAGRSVCRLCRRPGAWHRVCRACVDRRVTERAGPQVSMATREKLISPAVRRLAVRAIARRCARAPNRAAGCGDALGDAVVSG